MTTAPADHDIALALSDATHFFMTTTLYWDCSCPTGYIHNRTMLQCEDCGNLRDESPDARINEIRAAGIHIDWTEPEARATLTPCPSGTLQGAAQ